MVADSAGCSVEETVRILLEKIHTKGTKEEKGNMGVQECVTKSTNNIFIIDHFVFWKNLFYP